MVQSSSAANGAAGSEDGYTPRVVLVTGGAGFIGSHVAVRLLTRYKDYKVVVYDKMDYCASTRNLEAVATCPRFKLVRGDVCDADLLGYVLREQEVDTVLHFAAQTHVDLSFWNSLEFTKNNTYGTHVLLEACRVYGGVRRFVYVSTDEVYGDALFRELAGLPEESSLAPTNPYSAAKAGAELMARAYLTSYRLPVLVTRSNNVYGRRQFPEKLVPKFALRAARGQRLPVHGSGAATRSYLHVDDVAEAFDLILHKGRVGEVYNVGSQVERSVLSVARDVLAALGLPSHDRLEHVSDRAFQDRRYFICDAKLAALGWQERTPWEQGLAETLAWYREHVDGKEAGDAYWDKTSVEAALEAHPHPTLARADM